jgi:hypothetical protein
MRLNRRVADLESRNPAGSQIWVSIIQELGQTREDALSTYEAEHGSICDRNVILRVIV